MVNIQVEQAGMGGHALSLFKILSILQIWPQREQKHENGMVSRKALSCIP
jgi:hypothetical protein